MKLLLDQQHHHNCARKSDSENTFTPGYFPEKDELSSENQNQRGEFATKLRLMKDVFFPGDFVDVALESLQLYRSSALGVAGIAPVTSNTPSGQ